MRLAADIGGTKTVFALLDEAGKCVLKQSLASADYACFDAALQAFLPAEVSIDAACFGVAGAVLEQRCQLTNLNWLIDAQELQRQFNTPKVKLLNDMQAMALGMLQLSEEDLLELNPQAQARTGNIGVIAAGTGLGEAILYWDGLQHCAMATEGGHCDFAPQTPLQDALLVYLRDIYGSHVSYERIISGIGFSHLYDFLALQGTAPVCPLVSELAAGEDRNALISQLGVRGEDSLCVAVVNFFVELYGAEAGNLALKSLATGGVFIGGGIAPKILPALQKGLFLNAFTAKGRFNDLLSTVSIKVALNANTPLLGAMGFWSS